MYTNFKEQKQIFYKTWIFINEFKLRNDIQIQIARIACSIELPQYWREVDSEIQGRVYYNVLSKQYLLIHPGIEYFRFVLQQVRQITQNFNQTAQNDITYNSDLYFLNKEQKLMSFFDKLGRSYEVDIEDYILMREYEQQYTFSSQKNLYNHYENKIEQLNQMRLIRGDSTLQQNTLVDETIQKDESDKINNTSAKSMFDSMMEVIWNKSEEIRHLQTDNTSVLRENIINQQIYYQPKDYDGDNEEYLIADQHNSIPTKKKQPKRRKNSNMCDEHLLVLCSQLNVKFPEKVHLLSIIHEYVSLKEANPATCNWRFRVNENKEYFWINKQIKKSQTYYPFINELKMIVDIFEKSVKHKQKYAKQKHNFSKIYHFFDDNIEQKEIFEAITDYSKQFVKSYFINSSQDNTKSQKKQPLKKLMEVLRNNEYIDETTLKNEVLFQWKYSLQYPFQPKQIKDAKMQHSKQLLKGPSPLEIITNPLKYSRFQVEGYYFSSSEYISSQSSSSSDVSSSSEHSDSITSVSDEEEVESPNQQIDYSIQSNSIQKKLIDQKALKQQSMKTTENTMTNFTDFHDSISLQGNSKINGISSNYMEDSSDSDDNQVQQQMKGVQLNLDDGQVIDEKSITNQGGCDADEDEHFFETHIIQQLSHHSNHQQNQNKQDKELILDDQKEQAKLLEDLDLSNSKSNKLDQSSFNNILDDSTKMSIDQTMNDTVDGKFNMQTDEIKEVVVDEQKLFQDYNERLNKSKSQLKENLQTEQQQQTNKLNEYELNKRQIQEDKSISPKAIVETQKQLKDGKQNEKQNIKTEKLKVRQKSRDLQKKLKNIVDKYKPDESILANMKNALKNKQTHEKTENVNQCTENKPQLNEFKHKRIQTNALQKKPIQQRYSLQSKEDFNLNPTKQGVGEDQKSNIPYHKQDANKDEESIKSQKSNDETSHLQDDNPLKALKKSKQTQKSQKKKEELKPSKFKIPNQKQHEEDQNQNNIISKDNHNLKELNVIQQDNQQKINNNLKIYNQNQKLLDNLENQNKIRQENLPNITNNTEQMLTQETEEQKKNLQINKMIIDNDQENNPQIERNNVKDTIFDLQENKQKINEKKDLGSLKIQSDKLQINLDDSKVDEITEGNQDQDQNHENNLLKLFVTSKKSKKYRPQRNLEMSLQSDEQGEKQKKVESSPSSRLPRVNFDINLLGEMSPKDQKGPVSLIKEPRRKSKILNNGQVQDQPKQESSSTISSNENLGDDMTANKKGFFSFHKKRQESSSSSSEDSFQVMRIKNNYNVANEDVVFEEEYEEFDENENLEILKQQEQSRKERKRNNFNIVKRRSTVANGIQDPLIRAQFDIQYRKMSVFQFQNIKLQQGNQTVQQSVVSQKKNFNHWRDKIQFAIEATKLKEIFEDKKEEEYKLDDRYPKSFQYWISEKKSKDTTFKALQILEKVDKLADHQKSILLSEFMPRKIEASAAYTKFDIVKINHEQRKEYNLENEILDLKKKQQDQDFVQNETKEYEKLTKEFFNINLPSLITNYSKVKDNEKMLNSTNSNSQFQNTQAIQVQPSTNMITPRMFPANLPFRGDNPSPSRVKLTKLSKSSKLFKSTKLSQSTERKRDEIDQQVESNVGSVGKSNETEKMVHPEFLEQKYHKVKEGVTKQINFFFQNNLRLHFLEKEVLEKEEEKIQRSINSLQMWNNINLSQQQYDQCKHSNNYYCANNTSQNINSIVKNGINILKSASRLNRSLSPKTINQMRLETQKITSDLLLPVIPLRNQLNIYPRNITQNQFNQYKSEIINVSTGQLNKQRNEIFSSLPNHSNQSLTNRQTIYLPQVIKPTVQLKLTNTSLDKSPKLNQIPRQPYQSINNKMEKEKNMNNIVEEIHNLSKFEDNYTQYKLKATAEKLMNIKNCSIFKRGAYQQINDSKVGNQFSQETQQELNKLQLKYFKQKLDLLIFDIIVCGMNLTKDAKKLLVDSEVLQSRFYSKFRKYFAIIRNEILQMVIIQNNYQKFLADPNFDISIIEQVYKHITEKCQNIFLEMKTINVLEATILYQMKREASIHAATVAARHKQANNQEVKSYQIPQIEDTPPQESIHEKNTFLDESESSGDEDQYDVNPFKVNSNFFLLNSQLFSDYLSSIEDQAAGGRISSEEKKQLLTKVETKEQVQKKIAQLQKALNSPQSVSLLLRFLNSQGQIELFLRRSQMFKAQWKQLGKIHRINREILQKFYCYLDTGIVPTHLYLMCQKLNISVSQEGDLIWIAMLYCLFVIKFTKYSSIETLNYMLSYNHLIQLNKKKRDLFKDIQLIEFEPNHYDEYFNQLLEFNRVKKQLLFLQLGSRQKEEYIDNLSWCKFYDQKCDTVYYLQPQTGLKRTRLNRLTINLQRKYITIEKIKFLELIDIITLIARQDETLKISTLSNQTDTNKQPINSSSLPSITNNSNNSSVKIIKFTKRVPPTLIDQSLKQERQSEIIITRKEDLRRLQELKELEEIRRKKILEEQQRNAIAQEMWNKSALNNRTKQEMDQDDDYQDDEQQQDDFEQYSNSNNAGLQNQGDADTIS